MVYLPAFTISESTNHDHGSYVFFCERFIVWQIQPSPEETGEALVLTDVPAIRSGGFQSASDA